MQILNIILNIMAIIANGFLSWFAITAWFEFRRIKKYIIGMSRAISLVTTITMGNYVEDKFDQLNEMRETFNQLVEEERYEEAEELKNAITNVERNAKAAMKHFKDLCGDNCEIVVTKMKSHIDEEE
jgi:hypothetical protein